MSLLESLSLTPLEAGSLGCPLVLSDLPVHREITKANATFVPAGDCAELTRVLRSVDGRLSPGGRPWVWPHTWEDNARDLIQIFRSVSRRARVNVRNEAEAA
jgi:glycosyltransferase involved in cell wall biosynthesis